MKQIIRRIAACLVVASWALAPSAAPRSVFLEELTWPELRDELRAGATTILLPIGGTEQNGPHMALGKHNARVKALAAKIAAQLGNAIVAPVIAYVPEGNIEPPSEHMRFPGTVTVPSETFEKTLESAARSFRRHGFTDIVFLGDHGGYRASIARVAERMNREWSKSKVRIHALPEYYEAMTSEYSALLRSRGVETADRNEHAGVADTALTLATNAELVRSPKDVAPNAEGVRGDPRKASAELGKAGVDLVVARSVDAIRKAVATPRAK